MKQKLFLVGLIILIIILVGLWAYFFFVTKEARPGIFSNFNTNTTENRPVSNDTPSFVDTAPTTAGGEVQQLRQLTTRRVAAATFIEGGVRYVERGTGYIYDIMFSTGQETQITNTTIPRVVEAVFSKDGNRVALVSEDKDSRKAIVGTVTKNDVGEGVVDGVSLPVGAKNLHFSNSGDTLFFLLKTDTGASAYTYRFDEQTQTRLFSIPLSQVEMLWGTPPYVYTTPSGEKFGYIYAIKGGVLSYVTEKKTGLVAARFGESFLINSARRQGTDVFVLGSSTPSQISMQTIVKKCVDDPTATSSVYCAVPDSMPTEIYPDAWYKGVVSFTDSLVRLDLRDGTTVPIVNLLDRSGREVDVLTLYAGSDGKYLLFINKNDDTLWLYDLSLDEKN